MILHASAYEFTTEVWGYQRLIRIQIPLIRISNLLHIIEPPMFGLQFWSPSNNFGCYPVGWWIFPACVPFIRFAVSLSILSLLVSSDSCRSYELWVALTTSCHCWSPTVYIFFVPFFSLASCGLLWCLNFYIMVALLLLVPPLDRCGYNLPLPWPAYRERKGRKNGKRKGMPANRPRTSYLYSSPSLSLSLCLVSIT